MIEQQQQEMEQMKLKMDQEYAIKNVELHQAQAQGKVDQFVDEPPTDDEWEPIEDKFEDELSDNDKSGHTDDSDSSSELEC